MLIDCIELLKKIWIGSTRRIIEVSQDALDRLIYFSLSDRHALLWGEVPMVHQVRQYHFSRLPRFNHAAYHSIACMQQKLLLSITVSSESPGIGQFLTSQIMGNVFKRKTSGLRSAKGLILDIWLKNRPFSKGTIILIRIKVPSELEGSSYFHFLLVFVLSA